MDNLYEIPELANYANGFDDESIPEVAVPTDYEPLMEFKVQIETGEILNATLVQVVEIESKDYAIYILPGEKLGNVDILASYVGKDDEGYDKLIDITDAAGRKLIKEYIEENQEVILEAYFVDWVMKNKK